jgi:hypothetical protein
MSAPDVNEMRREHGVETVRHAFDAAVTAAKAAPNGHGAAPAKSEPAKPLIQSSAEFVKGFVPPDYLIDGILQRRFIYSNTGRTGGGKTAISLLMAAHVALAKPIGRCGVEKGRVLYFAGENPDDIRMRWIVMAAEMGFDIDTIDVLFIPGVFKISQLIDRIVQEVTDFGAGGVSLVIVDTSAAYFEGDAENDNVQLGVHARRLRDSLTKLPGGPTVVVNCHPAKNAGDDNLIPRGGGAFLAEVDGNLTCKKQDEAVELHTQGKFRGPDFAPINFVLRTVTSPALKDSKGRCIPSVIALPLSDIGQEEIATMNRTNENKLLAALAVNPGASQAALATKLGWFLRDGSPHKMMVSRAIDKLVKHKFIRRGRDGPELTDQGRKSING